MSAKLLTEEIFIRLESVSAEPEDIRNIIFNIIPEDVITPFNTNNILQLIFLSCFFGVMLNRAGEYAAWAKDGVKFKIPVGMQFNMDGTAYYVAVVSMMLAKTFGINMDADFLLSFFLIEFFMALTGIGLIIMPPMLSGLGIPPTAVAHFIGIKPILDMFGTAQSVVGNITSAFIITHLENKVDDKIYRANE